MRQVPEAIAERLEAAAAVFADRGFSETRIEDIAEATGVPRATLYYYFAGKEDILAWLLRRTLAAAAEAVAAAIRPRSRPAGQRLAAVVDAQLRVMAEHPDACRALAADAGRVGRIPEIAAAIQNGFHRPVRRLLADGEADGSLRRLTDPETAASAIYGAVTMAGLHFLVADNHLDAARVSGEVSALLLDGLGAGAPVTAREEGDRRSGAG